MRTTISGLALASCMALLAVGCTRRDGDVARSPEQWKAELAPQLDALVPQFRDCYVASKAEWAKMGQAAGSVARTMKPKPRETVLVGIYIDGAWNTSAKIQFDNAHATQVPPAEQSSDGNLAKCVREVVAKNLRKPTQTDTHDSDGVWHVVFVADPSVPPAATKH